MSRYAFFSFHYRRDIWRVCEVRNSGLTQNDPKAMWFDHSLWEQTKLKGDQAIKNLIEDGLRGASVTVVLIGTETASRRWVRYEIQRSLELRKGLVGVRINNLRNQGGYTDAAGPNPFDAMYITDSLGTRLPMSSFVSTYDYVLEDGYVNLASWIESAAITANQ